MDDCTCRPFGRRGVTTPDDETITDHRGDCPGPWRPVAQGKRPDRYAESDLAMLPGDRRDAFRSIARRRAIQVTVTPALIETRYHW